MRKIFPQTQEGREIVRFVGIYMGLVGVGSLVAYGLGRVVGKILE